MSNLLSRYREVVGNQIIDELSQQAVILKGLKIVHINSTHTGGGVAEILSSMLPLMRALDIEAEWEIIHGNPDFFDCTKLFHNCIQGLASTIPDLRLINVYENTNKENAEKLATILEKGHIVFIHDPQPAALIDQFPKRENKWIWRCHIDASNPQKDVWDFLKTFIDKYDASIFSLKDFVQTLPHPVHVITPGIDPLSEKNMALSEEEIQAIYPRFSIDSKRPFILQVSRFDYFKDPIGVIKTYQLLKKYSPELQLVLAGGGAPDDPEGEAVLKEVQTYASQDPDIHVLYLPSDSHLTINALQRAATIIMQKSLKEGFGLTVAEGLWKGKPVIGGNVGGIRVQIMDGENGFLVNNPKDAYQRIQYLLENPLKIEEMGKRGKEFVYEHFLITRHLKDYLNVAISLLYPTK
jgi:trehalose synthase